MKTLLNNFGIVAHNLKRRDIDWLHLNVGFERSGKSTLSFRQAEFIEPGFDVKKQIVWTPETFTSAVYELEPDQVLIVDEGSNVFNVRDHCTNEVKEAVKTLQVCGERNLFIIVNLPSFSDLVPDIRNRRAMSLCRITHRGSFKFYNRANMNKIKIDDNSRAVLWTKAKTSFTDNWQELKTKRWSEYKLLKHEWAEKRGRKSRGKEGEDVEFVTTGEFAKATGYDLSTIYKKCLAGDITGFRIENKRMRIPMGEMVKFREAHKARAGALISDAAHKKGGGPPEKIVLKTKLVRKTKEQTNKVD